MNGPHILPAAAIEDARAGARRDARVPRALVLLHLFSGALAVALLICLVRQ